MSLLMLRGGLLLLMQVLLLILSAIVTDVISPSLMAFAALAGWALWFVLSQMNWWDVFRHAHFT